jgi:hypothetical protein
VCWFELEGMQSKIINVPAERLQVAFATPAGSLKSAPAGLLGGVMNAQNQVSCNKTKLTIQNPIHEN